LAEAALGPQEFDAVIAGGVVFEGTTIRHVLPITYR